jgi:hypothetical protein
VLLPSKGQSAGHGNRSSAPELFHQLLRCRGMFDWCNWLGRDTFLNVRVVDDSRICIPRATTGGPWLFFPKILCKWVDHCFACIVLQEGRHERGSALEHHELHAELWSPLPSCWSLWSASQRTFHRLWDASSSKCLFEASGHRGLPAGVVGQHRLQC